MRKRKAGRMRERRWDEKEEGWEKVVLIFY